MIGDVAPVRTASPTPKLYDDSQIPVYKKLADTLHAYDCKVALQLFHPEYDVPGVGRMIMQAGMARQAAAKAQLMEILMRQLSRHSLLSSLPRMPMRSFITTCSIL